MQINDEAKLKHPESESREPVWTYRGYRMGPAEFNTSMAHFYRGEISRANVWRQRLDATTNWAVVTTAATFTFAFGQTSGHHGVIILNTLLITLFLFIEARRYQYYELWSYRIRHMETDFFAAMLVPPFSPESGWAESLAENLLHPKFSISMWEAFGRRFRRNYFWIYIILALAWFAKIMLHPTTTNSWGEMVQRAAVGAIPGHLVITIGAFFYGFLILTGLFTTALHDSSGEVLPHLVSEEDKSVNIDVDQYGNGRKKAWFRSNKRREQIVALIITNQARAVASRIMSEMNRGTTALEGKGMYTGEQHSVLMCALTVTEVEPLKCLVRDEDSDAFVIISSAKEVLGSGFDPLSD